jgi:hypothetical protein
MAVRLTRGFRVAPTSFAVSAAAAGLLVSNPAYASYPNPNGATCNLTHSLAAMAELCFQWR